MLKKDREMISIFHESLLCDIHEFENYSNNNHFNDKTVESGLAQTSNSVGQQRVQLDFQSN